MFFWRPKENIMCTILSQQDILKMPTQNAGLGEKKNILIKRDHITDHYSTQLEMHVVNFLTENYSTKLKLRSQASHAKKWNVPLMFTFTWLRKSLYHLAFLLKVSSLKMHSFDCHQTVRPGFSMPSPNSIQINYFSYLQYSWLPKNLSSCCDCLPQPLQ